MYTKSTLTRHPKLYHFFVVMICAIVVYLLCALGYNSSIVARRWNEVTNRHRIFFFFSIYFVIFFGLMILTGISSSYNGDSLRAIIMFPLANLYILTLQVLWRLSPKGKKELDEYIAETEVIVIQDLNYQRKGLGYFSEEVEVEILKKDPIRLTQEINFDTDSSLTIIEDNVIIPKQDEFVYTEDNPDNTLDFISKREPNALSKKPQLSESEIRARFSSIDKQLEKTTFSKKIDTNRIVSDEKLNREIKKEKHSNKQKSTAKDRVKTDKKKEKADSSDLNTQDPRSIVLNTEDSRLVDTSDANLLNQSAVGNEDSRLNL